MSLRNRSLLSLLLFTLTSPTFSAYPAQLKYTDCFSGDESQKLQVSNVYGQIISLDEKPHHLNLTVFGNSPLPIAGIDNSSSLVSTLFSSTSVLTLSTYSESVYLCSPIRPPSPLSSPATDNNAIGNTSYCPIPAGPFGLSSAVYLGQDRSLTTLTTRLRAVDPFSKEILCIDVATTPLKPSKSGYPYGQASYIFWVTVALALAYWIIVGIARISSAWDRGVSRQRGTIWAKVESAGFILASAISGERFAHSPALMRFCTPSMRDIIFHSQYCTALAMVAVNWPAFVYPLLAQTAWSTLTYNVTLTSPSKPHQWDPLSVESFTPPSNFADQVADTNSPLYIDPNTSNTLFLLPQNATNGISSFAYTVGIRPEDLFPICMIIFLGIMAGATTLSLIVWGLDWIATLIGKAIGSAGSHAKLPSTRFSAASHDDNHNGLGTNPATSEENKSMSGHHLFRTTSRFTLPLAGTNTPVMTPKRKTWWRVRSNLNSFHGSVLHGNLVRILVLFHLPVTIFSCYEMTRPKSQVSIAPIVLAILSFIIFSVVIPIILVIRVRLTSTSKLYEETRTLLTFGPLYNHYRHGSQMFAGLLFATNIAFGVTIGCGQRSGTAQSIIILVVEVVSALVTSIWLPWGQGASMGLISFLFCVARIVVAVLLVILAPKISIDHGPAGWVAYGILVILALVYLALFLILLVKLLEAVVRIAGGIGFERSSHVVDSGLLGACGLFGCCGGRRHRRRSNNRSSRKSKQQYQAAPRDLPPDQMFYPPGAIGASSRKPSTASSPPSVLRPEHAMRPYQEETDDENGFIMGAWRGTQGYHQVNEVPPVKPSSGFARVGGGRAHVDSPYAITGGSTSMPNFPGSNPSPYQSVPLQAMMSSPVFVDDDSPPPSLSSVARQGEYSSGWNGGANGNELPPGAMQPAHVRRRSQTAVIENAGAGLFMGGKDERDSAQLPPSSYPGVVGQETDQQKKKPWYHLRRNRPHSADNEPSSSALDESEPVSLDPPAGRSFVVIRDKKPQQPKPRQASDVGPLSTYNAENAGTTPTQGSFVVLRGNDAKRSSRRASAA